MNKVAQINEIPLDKITSGPVVSDPRKVVADDPRDLIFRDRALKSIAHVEIKGIAGGLTGTLVSECHVLVNRHLVDTVAVGADDKLKPSASCDKNDKKLGVLSDDELNKRVTLKVGFLPDGSSKLHTGFKILTEGKIVLTGQNPTMGAKNGDTSDWMIIQIPKDRTKGLTPLKIASETEMKANSQNLLMAGCPWDRVVHAKKINQFFEECKMRYDSGTTSSNCIETGGGSSSPGLIYPDGKENPPKIAMLSK